MLRYKSELPPESFAYTAFYRTVLYTCSQLWFTCMTCTFLKLSGDTLSGDTLWGYPGNSCVQCCYLVTVKRKFYSIFAQTWLYKLYWFVRWMNLKSKIIFQVLHEKVHSWMKGLIWGHQCSSDLSTAIYIIKWAKVFSNSKKKLRKNTYNVIASIDWILWVRTVLLIYSICIVVTTRMTSYWIISLFCRRFISQLYFGNGTLFTLGCITCALIAGGIVITSDTLYLTGFIWNNWPRC